MALSKEPLQQKIDALRFWQILDFISQKDNPSAGKHASITFVDNVRHEKSTVSIKDTFETSLQNEGEVLTNAKLRLAAEIELKRKNIEMELDISEIASLRRAALQLQMTPSSIEVYLGAIPHEYAMSQLQGQLNGSIAELSPSPGESSEICLALIKLDSAGRLADFTLSPLVWAIGRTEMLTDNPHKQYRDENARLRSLFIRYYGDNSVSFKDLQAIETGLLLIFGLQGFLFALNNEAAKNGDSGLCPYNPLDRVIISYKAIKAENRRTEKARGKSSDVPASGNSFNQLQKAFYGDDIHQLIETIRESHTSGKTAHGSLGLLFNYLEGGLTAGLKAPKVELLNYRENMSAPIAPQCANESLLSKQKLVDFYQHALDPTNTPPGRWPSKHNLSLMQQLAVNCTIAQLRSQDGRGGRIMSVNGPPGTGKTTLLKDIIAANIVEKARLLCELCPESPDSAFSKVEIDGIDDLDIFQLTNRAAPIAALSILICSSNNGAVDNIAADPLYGESFLGSASDAERELFCNPEAKNETLGHLNWFDQKDTLNSGDTQRSDDSAASDRDLYFSKYAACQVRSSRPTSSRNEPCDDSHAALDVLISAHLGKKANVRSFSNNTLKPIATAASKCASSELDTTRYRTAVEAFNKQYRYVECLLSQISDLPHDDRDRTSCKIKKQGSVSGWLLKHFGRRTGCPRTIDPLLIDSLCSASRNADSRAKAHLFNPAETANIHAHNGNVDLNIERDKLLLYALRVTREFTLASSCMASNLASLHAYWNEKYDGRNGEAGPKLKLSPAGAQKAVPALFQSLAILTPTISTSFASVERLFSDIPISMDTPSTFGLCIIDEAGQAAPYAALGALARCKNALVVGDPSQIEPIVTKRELIFRKFFGGNISKSITDDSSSVQSFADAANPLGHFRKANPNSNNLKKEYEWVGCPLVIHRRCESPMFDISNIVSYDGDMLNECRPLDRSHDRENLDKLCLSASQWIDIKGDEAGRKDHFVAEQGELVLSLINDRLTGANSEDGCSRSLPSIFVISPFKSVIKGLREMMAEYLSQLDNLDDSTEKLWMDFSENNIGTVHTFQGKEADEVIFLLGCSEQSMGAIRWVSPNIVNVAITRARRRLYIVGDYDVWREVPCMRVAKKHLDDTWAGVFNQLKKECESEDEQTRSRAQDDLDNLLPPPQTGLANIRGLISALNPSNTQLIPRESTCIKFGYSNFSELINHFDCCKDANGDNEVLEVIVNGMHLYETYSPIFNSLDTPRRSWAFVVEQFYQAIDLLLLQQLFEPLKRLKPRARNTRGTPIAKLKDLTLGNYAHLLTDDLTVQNGCARGYELKRRSDSAIAPSDEDKLSPSDSEWWREYGETLSTLTLLRNNTDHAGGTLPETDAVLPYLFARFDPPSDQPISLGLLDEADNLVWMNRGVLDDSFTPAEPATETREPSPET